jgi:coenzyme F420-reducing hydrogenase alpha subunit
MSAVHAMEAAIGAEITKPVRDLRRLLYCGAWIESHGIQVYMLQAPDFLGYRGAPELAKDYPEVVMRGLALKKAGNEIIAAIVGRETNIKVGGFYKAPARKTLHRLIDTLEKGRDDALESVRWVASFEFPDIERDYEFVCLSHPDEYPFNEGRIISSRASDIAAEIDPDHFEEINMPQATTVSGRVKARGHYLTGPLARYSLNFDKLPAVAQVAASEAGLGAVCRNPYQSIIVRSVELVFAFDEALRLIKGYEEPDHSASLLEPRAGIGRAATEAPRGMLYHRYHLAADGSIGQAVIVPPTSQNKATIEEDLRAFIPGWLGMEDEDLRRRCQHSVRNYGPSVSCAIDFVNI